MRHRVVARHIGSKPPYGDISALDVGVYVATYEVAKYVGAYAAALNGIDVLTFTAGVGENGISNRAAICEYLGYLGIKIDPERNNVRGKEALISTDDSKVQVWVVPTNEELMIARDTAELVKAAQ